MAQKLGRNYQLTVDSPNFKTPLVVTLPFTIEFDITRNTLTSANVCQVRLYNLSPSNRNALRRSDTQYGKPFESIVLRAGYGNAQNGNNLPIIFSGNVSQAWSKREGVNFITQIECYDGGFAFVNAQVPTNLSNPPAGTPYKALITNLIQSLPNVTLGAVSNYPGATPRGGSYTGSTIDVLNTLTKGGFFIDNGVGNALTNNDFTKGAGPVFKIDKSVGLLDTPEFQNYIVRFNMLFEPTLTIGSLAILNSSSLESVLSNAISSANSNGSYKITSVKHRGMISQTVSGDLVTTAEFFALQPNLTAVPSASGGV